MTTTTNELATVSSGAATVRIDGLRIAKWAELRVAAQIAHGAGLARNVEEAAARIEYGSELGFSPMMALTNVHIVEGRPTLSATAIASQIRRAPGYHLEVRELSETACEVAVSVKGKLVGVSRFTIEDAEQAELTGGKGKTYKKYPRNMLFARAVSNLARWYVPELFHGSVYSQEEMSEVAATVDDDDVSVASDEEAPPSPAAEPELTDAVFEEVPQDVTTTTEDNAAAAPAAVAPAVGPAPDKDLERVRARLRFLRVPEAEWPTVVGNCFTDSEPTPVSLLNPDEVKVVMAGLADSSRFSGRKK